MKCPNCNNEINESAKFCKFCGTEVVGLVSFTPQRGCPECGSSVSDGAKFCRSCGAKLQFSYGTQYETSEYAEVVPSSTSVKVNRKSNITDAKVNYTPVTVRSDEFVSEELSNYVTWHILPGQLAARVNQKELQTPQRYRGVYVSPGTKALFFEDGKYVASLDGGKYAFRNVEFEEEKKEKPARTFLKSVLKLFKQKGKEVVFRDKAIYDVVLVRGAEFPLYYDLLDVNTKGIRSNVALHLLCKITNLDDFFRVHLADKKMITMEAFGESLESAVKTAVNEVLSAYDVLEVETSTELRESLVDALNKKITAIYSYVSLSSIVNITAKREEIEAIRKMKEELYVDELKLEQLHDRNTFLNRLQSEENSQELATARNDVDFVALMNKVNEDGLLNNAKHKQFKNMLSAQYELATATTTSETEIALNKLRQNNMLSAEEIDALEIQIAHRAEMGKLTSVHDLTMATLQNRIVQDREKLKWEIEIGNQAHANELNRSRMTAEYQDERRQADLDFKKREVSDKLDLLKQAQAIREEREKAKHERLMEEKKLDAQNELEKYKITSNMSFEQIMASNPNITPEAAQALAKKFEAEAAMANNSIATELQKQHNDDIKAILAQQMELTKDIITAQTNAKNAALESKQAELERVHSDSEKNQDRFLTGMQTTINAVASATRGSGASTVKFCPNCGRRHTSINDMVCVECGTTL